MNSEKSEENEDSEDSYRKEENQVGLSEEARLSEEEKENVKDLGNNRYLISTSSVNEENVQEELEKEEEEESKEGLKKGISKEISERSEVEEKDEEKVEEIADLVMSKLEDKELTQEKPEGEDKIQDDEVDIESNTLEDPLNLVKLLSTYNVSLDSSVEDLIKRIKEKGEEHIVEEIEKMEGR